MKLENSKLRISMDDGRWLVLDVEEVIQVQFGIQDNIYECSEVILNLRVRRGKVVFEDYIKEEVKLKGRKLMLMGESDDE